MDSMDAHQDNVVHVNNFINLIRRENEDPIYNFGSDLINDCFDKAFTSYDGNSMFDLTHNNFVNVYDPSSTLSHYSFSSFHGKVKGEEGEEEKSDKTRSSKNETTTTITTAIIAESSKSKPRLKPDRSKTLITERRRRGQMKEKLYALRTLVPNITKMDKASIIGDAVEYVHKLQAQANKLKAEIAGLETSTLVYESYHGSINNILKVQVPHNNNHQITKKIMQIDMFQVEEKGYYAKIVCTKGKGVAASLYKALESLKGFNVQNSNLVTVCDSFLLTFTLNVNGSADPEINLPNLKLWVTGALLNQGFEVMPFFHV
ncbi:hypothetical protein RIF29_27603 [Crotalaria pallida]|uniref:BHLH domain-containing protein n=1 Tax=Crotalaria pallida TaxID=3830 RepID=A0AAN9I164_CROPI